jgi:uncharacterized integral membrane protein (TIGR00698 family)
MNGLLIPLGALLCLWPGVSAPMALVGGVAMALGLGNRWLAHTRRATHLLLALAVVGLGAGMDLRVVAAAGAHGALYTAASIALCVGLGLLLGRRLRVPGAIAALITVGTAICGGSAIAAVVPLLRPREHEVSIALGTVFLLNAVALFLFPPIGHLVGLTPEGFGLWSALSIHDTSSVIGAAMSYGGRAVEIATTVKLARALWIVPVTLGIGWWKRQEGGRARRPWFIAGFVAAAALVTLFPVLRPAGLWVSHGAHRLLVVTLFLVGANLTRESLGAVGARPLVQGASLWVLMAGVTLAAVAGGVVR